MSEPRIIKRYANRKLYDTQHSCYVTLDQIAEMVRESEDVRIVDNTTKEDLTSVTLAQIIFEEEKKQRLLPLVGLKAIIQTSGESIQDFVSQIRDEVDARVGKVFRRGPDGEEDEGMSELGGTEGGDGREDEDDTPRTTAAVRDFLRLSERRLDEWQGQVDQHLRRVLDSLHPIPRIQKELQQALERINVLEQQVRDLDGK